MSPFSTGIHTAARVNKGGIYKKSFEMAIWIGKIRLGERNTLRNLIK
jgi:hypothetical protein